MQFELLELFFELDALFALDALDALFYNSVCVSLALIVFGIAFIIIENKNQKSKAGTEKGSETGLLPDRPGMAL